MSENDENVPNHEELPRPGSVLYNFHFRDETSKKKTLKKWKRLNKYLVIPLYRIRLLPLLGFGKVFLILKTIGWKTGKLRRTPLEYKKYDGTIVIFSARGEDATWLKNMRANPGDVSVTLGFHSFKPRTEYLLDKNQKLEIMKWYISKYGRAAKILFGWDPKTDYIESTDLSKLSNLLTIVVLHKNEKFST